MMNEQEFEVWQGKHSHAHKTGHILTSKDHELLEKLFLKRPDGTRSISRFRKIWKNAVGLDLSRIGIQQWEMESHDRRR